MQRPVQTATHHVNYQQSVASVHLLYVPPHWTIKIPNEMAMHHEQTLSTVYNVFSNHLQHGCENPNWEHKVYKFITSKQAVTPFALVSVPQTDI